MQAPLQGRPRRSCTQQALSSGARVRCRLFERTAQGYGRGKRLLLFSYHGGIYFEHPQRVPFSKNVQSLNEAYCRRWVQALRRRASRAAAARQLRLQQAALRRALQGC